MNKILDWKDKCLVCGEKELLHTRMIIQEKELPCEMCEKCMAVYALKDDYMHFFGFLPKEMYFKIISMDNPVIKAKAEPIQQMGLN